MTNPTEKECKALAERWPAEFSNQGGPRRADGLEGGYLEFKFSNDEVFAFAAVIRPVWSFNETPISAVLGLSALTWKCREIAGADNYCLTENLAADGESIEWQLCDIAPYLPVRGCGDTPWSALLAVALPTSSKHYCRRTSDEIPEETSRG